MKTLKNLFIVNLLILIVLPLNIHAANQNTGVGTDLRYETCISGTEYGGFQDSSIYTSGSTYFSRCMKSTCNNGRYNNVDYASYESENSRVVCTNGNSNPYREARGDGCTKYYGGKTLCNSGDVSYCSKLEYVDCSRRTDGSSFTTTTKARPTQPRPTTTQAPTTTTAAPSNTKLKSVVLSTGTIDFKPDTYSYNLTIDAIVNSIDVTALPADSSSTVNVKGNTNLTNGSTIVITVTGADKTTSEYKIKIKKNENIKLSNNTKLKRLTIEDYPIDFNSRTNNYNLTIKEGVSELKIDYEAEDTASIVMISGNENLKSGDKISISVTAPDGSVGYYTININVKKKSNFLKIIFLIIIILALIAGGFYIYKKFIASKEGEKYEYE